MAIGKGSVVVLIIFHILRLGADGGGLSYNFYQQSCPQVEDTVRGALRHVFMTDPSSSPALLRLMFHDCQVQVTFSSPYTFTIVYW